MPHCTDTLLEETWSGLALSVQPSAILTVDPNHPSRHFKLYCKATQKSVLLFLHIFEYNFLFLILYCRYYILLTKIYNLWVQLYFYRRKLHSNTMLMIIYYVVTFSCDPKLCFITKFLHYFKAPK